MINTSAEYGQNVYQECNSKWHVGGTVIFTDGRTYSLDDNDFWDDILKISDKTSKSGEFSIGQAIPKTITATLQNFDGRFDSYNFAGAVIIPWVGMTLPDKTVEKIQIGVFNVDEYVSHTETMKISAYDNMSKFDRKYDSTLSYPASLLDIVKDACTKCGVTFGNSSFLNANYIVASRPSDSDMTYRDIIAYAAQLAVCFARCDNTGVIWFGWYDMDRFYPDSGNTLDGGNFSSTNTDTVDGGNFSNSNTDILMGGVFRQGLPTPPELSGINSCDLDDDDVRITGVQLIPADDKKSVLIKGTKDYAITIDKNPLAQSGLPQLVANIAYRLVDFQFRPMSVEALPNPAIEAGDVAYFTDAKGKKHMTIVSDIEATVGGYETFIADAQSEAEQRAEHRSTSAKSAAVVYGKKGSDYITTGQMSESEAAAKAAETQQALINLKPEDRDAANAKIAAYTSPPGEWSTAEGMRVASTGQTSHAEGYYTIAGNHYTHAEGLFTIASGWNSHAEGNETIAYNNSAHAEGNETEASGSSSHAEGNRTRATKWCAHVEGDETEASGSSSHAEGNSTTASGDYSHAEGWDTKACGLCSHAEGDSLTASGDSSHAEGWGTTASGDYSHAEGNSTTAHDYCEHAGGYYNKASAGNQTAFATTNNAFVIGNGTSDSARSNCFRVTFDGNVYGCAAFNASGADYAEYFEWADENPDKQDRVGRFVTLSGTKICFAKPDDDVLGIVSGCPSVIGDTASESWSGRYARDIFGRPILETVNIPETQKKDKNGKVIRTIPAHTELRFKENPDYKPEKEMDYVPREKRPEWSAVGMMGKIVLIDDGTCEPGGYCEPAANGSGIGTAAAERNNCRVMERLDGTHIRVCLK